MSKRLVGILLLFPLFITLIVVFGLFNDTSSDTNNTSQISGLGCLLGQKPSVYQADDKTLVSASEHYPEIDSMDGSPATSVWRVGGCLLGTLSYVYYNGSQTFLVVEIEGHGTDVHVTHADGETYVSGIARSLEKPKVVHVPIASLWEYPFPNGTRVRILNTRYHLWGDAHFEGGDIIMNDTYMPQ